VLGAVLLGEVLRLVPGEVLREVLGAVLDEELGLLLGAVLGDVLECVLSEVLGLVLGEVLDEVLGADVIGLVLGGLLANTWGDTRGEIDSNRSRAVMLLVWVVMVLVNRKQKNVYDDTEKVARIKKRAY
jgi:hypothetical protein